MHACMHAYARFGKHSEHAFYSLNVRTEWKLKVVIDFYEKILEWDEI